MKQILVIFCLSVFSLHLFAQVPEGINFQGIARDSSGNILKNAKINPSQPSILLKHAPTDIPVAKEAGISLQLSGHAHAGQVFPVGLISRLVYKGYAYGLKQEENFFIYTSSGAGTWGPPMRGE